MRWLVFRSVTYVYYRNWRHGGFRFANRKLCGWRVGRVF